VAEKGGQSRASGAHDDSFDLLLKRVAHVSEPGSSFAPPLDVGDELAGARLRIVRVIGEGAMGRVYEAYDRERRGSVALKTLKRLDPGSVYLLKSEFRSLADVGHPNVVRLHELFGEGEEWFFTMELVDGERFDDWVRPRNTGIASGKLDEARLRAALSQLCEGITAIHAAGKLHRDLKPSNVLVTAEGRVVVLDFGLAADAGPGGEGQALRSTGVCGTPAYMAPEQAAGSPATTASDFYALGVMLFESLTGELPFVGQPDGMLVDKQRGPARSLKATQVPGDLAATCDALLARDPTLRPDGEALRAALGPWRGSPVVRDRNRTFEGDPLLGRESELGRLGDAYEATLLGKAVVMFVSGESGIGKSALCNAFLDTLRAQGRALALKGRCHERESVPFKGFDSLIDDLSGHLRQLGQEAMAVLPREVYALARIFPVLERVAAVAEAPKKAIFDPQDLKRRAFDAFWELLSSLRNRSPLVVLLDDAQWLDQDSTRFMEHLLVRPDPVPMLILCAHRSEGADHNALLQSLLKTAQRSAKLDVRALVVGPLSRDALHGLAERLLPQDADAAALAALVAEAQGSPFFAAEIARGFALVPHGERRRLPSLTEALALHVKALPDAAQRLLALLALADRPLSPELVLDPGRSDGHALLDTLRRERLVRMSFDPLGARQVECYHDKIREQATASLEAPQVRELSLALSQRLLAEPENFADLLARTFVQAGLPEQAAPHAARAAEQAQAALAFDRAATLYAQALAHGHFEPDRLHALRVSRADALAWAGQGERAAEAYLEAALGADAEVARELTSKAGEQYLYCGSLERGRALFGGALRSIGISFPQSLPAALASVTWSRARLRLRGLAFRRRAEVDPRTERELEALESATRTLTRSDQLRAADFSARWVRRALDAGHAVQAARALSLEYFVLAFSAPHGAHIDAVQALCERLCAETGDEFARYLLIFVKGMRLFNSEQPLAALSDLERSHELNVAYPNPGIAYDIVWNRLIKATALFQLGRFDEATALALSQLADARQRDDRPAGVGLAQFVATGLLAADRPDQAVEILDQFYVPPDDREMTMQDYFYLSSRMQIEVYRGDARRGWYAYAAYRERFFASFMGKVMRAGWLEVYASNVAYVAAAETENDVERAHLQREAMRLARRAMRKTLPRYFGPGERRVAYLRGDHDAVVASLREEIATGHPSPLRRQMLRRSLGEMLRGDEGAVLVTEADEFFHQCGVVDPARFLTSCAVSTPPGTSLPLR
jgi:serine/threonine protein kinase